LRRRQQAAAGSEISLRGAFVAVREPAPPAAGKRRQRRRRRPDRDESKDGGRRTADGGDETGAGEIFFSRIQPGIPPGFSREPKVPVAAALRDAGAC
jgi:hypothetical protein